MAHIISQNISVVINFIFPVLNATTAWHPTDLDYADDVTLVEPTCDWGQQVLNSLHRAGEVVGAWPHYLRREGMIPGYLKK